MNYLMLQDYDIDLYNNLSQFQEILFEIDTVISVDAKSHSVSLKIGAPLRNFQTILWNYCVSVISFGWAGEP